MHMNWKIPVTIIIPVLAIMIIVFVMQNNAEINTNKDPIKIGITAWSGDAHAFVALKKGFFEKNGVEVELDFQDQYSEIEKRYLDGELDGVFATLTDAAYYNIIGKKSKIVYATDFSNDADVIVGKGTSLVDVKGTTIGVENIEGYSHIFVLKALEKYGLDEKDVKFVVVPAQDVLLALEKGDISAGHTWEPTKAQALSSGYNVLFSGGQIPGIITSALVFNSEIIEERPEDIAMIVKSMVEAQEYRDSNWDESLFMMADSEGLSVNDVESGFVGMNTLDLEENQQAFTKSNSTASVYDSGDFIINYYQKRGKVVPNIDDIIEPKFIKSLTNQ